MLNITRRDNPFVRNRWRRKVTPKIRPRRSTRMAAAEVTQPPTWSDATLERLEKELFATNELITDLKPQLAELQRQYDALVRRISLRKKKSK